MSGEAVDVSVVVPLLNEERTVAELVTRICAVFDRRRERFELLLVDDGSHDATAARLREIEAEDPRVRVFEFTRYLARPLRSPAGSSRRADASS